MFLLQFDYIFEVNTSEFQNIIKMIPMKLVTQYGTTYYIHHHACNDKKTFNIF